MASQDNKAHIKPIFIKVQTQNLKNNGFVVLL